MEEFNKELIKQNIYIILTLEYLGIKIESVKEDKDKRGVLSKTAYYYSVPESSTLEVKDTDFKEVIKTDDGLKRIAKETLIAMLLENCKREFGEDADEFISDVKNNISDYFKFYAKVRRGEVWNKELAEQRVKEFVKEMEATIGYTEV